MDFNVSHIEAFDGQTHAESVEALRDSEKDERESFEARASEDLDEAKAASEELDSKPKASQGDGGGQALPSAMPVIMLVLACLLAYLIHIGVAPDPRDDPVGCLKAFFFLPRVIFGYAMRSVGF